MKRWWEKDEVTFADLVGGLTHLNRRTNGDIDAEYERYIRALKRFAKGYCAARYEDDDRDEEAPQIRKFVRDATQWYLDEGFFDGTAFRTLVRMPRLIASESLMRKARDKIKRVELTEAELYDTHATHRSLVEATAQYDELHDRESRKNVGFWLGGLLYVVRCNLDHGEKTPFGPDLAKAERDVEVLSVALPVVQDVVLRTLEHPEHRFAVYGTLRSGEPNHGLVADLGAPTDGSVTGSIRQVDSYPVFRWWLEGDNVPVELYASPRLTGARWESLDRHERGSYRRLFVPTRIVASGEHVVATIYADALEAPRPQRYPPG